MLRRYTGSACDSSDTRFHESASRAPAPQELFAPRTRPMSQECVSDSSRLAEWVQNPGTRGTKPTCDIPANVSAHGQSEFADLAQLSRYRNGCKYLA